MSLPVGSWLYCTDACGITERSVPEHSEGNERVGARDEAPRSSERGEAAPAKLSGPMILIKIRAENAPVFLFSIFL